MLTAAPGAQPGKHMGAGHDQAAGRHEEARAGLFRADHPHHPGGGQLRGKLVHVAPPNAGYSSAGRLQTIFTW